MKVVRIVVGATLVVGGLWPSSARAGADPGSGFGLYSLEASAPGIQLREDDSSLCFKSAAAANGCEGVVPEAVSTLRNGPIGHGLAAVAWPGGIAAGGGSLLITAGGADVPPQATLLNEPVRADAYTNVGQPTVSNDAAPGSTMTATALPAKVSAEASVGQDAGAAPFKAGRTVATSRVELTGASTAEAVAHSEVKDLSLAGVVTIASVVSDAKATTDGARAVARGTTTASGIAVAGIPVTVDDRGVTAEGTTASLGAEQSAVDSALSQSGVTMALGAPQGKPQGGSVSYSAQSLVVVFTNPTGFTSTLVLGGANVSVTASPGFAVSLPGVVLPSAAAVVPAPAAGGTGPVSVPGGVNAPAPAQPALPVTSQEQPAVSAPALPAALELPDPGPLRTRTVLLVLGGALLLVTGLRRLPDDVLRYRPAECLLEEAP